MTWLLVGFALGLGYGTGLALLAAVQHWLGGGTKPILMALDDIDTQILALRLRQADVDKRLRLLGEPRDEETGPHRLPDCGTVDRARRAGV